LSSEGWALLGEFKTSSDVGAIRDSRTVTINGLSTTSVYWLQVTNSDGHGQSDNSIILSGLTQVAETTLIRYTSAYCAVLSGYYEVTGVPKVSTSPRASSDSNAIVTILVNEVTSS